jgi:hypothetical protein
MQRHLLRVGTLTEIARSAKGEPQKFAIYQMANKRYVAEIFDKKTSRHAFFDSVKEAREYVQNPTSEPTPTPNAIKEQA